MSNRYRFPKVSKIALKLVVGLVLTTLPSYAQKKDPYSTEYRSAPVKSRAEQEAEQRVALSADKIIDLLRQEPGLLLEAKRVLVRKAFEQGRILDPDDLTDEALFDLLRRDQNIRVLVTREIEDRGYIRAKPTQQQIEQEREANPGYRVPPGTSQGQAPAETGLKATNKEEEYWRKHDDSIPSYPQAQPEPQPNQSVPATPAMPRSTPPAENPARQLEMANLPDSQDLYDGMGVDSGSAFDSNRMTRITPEQLPGLLSTSVSSGTSFAMVDGIAQQRDRSSARAVPSYSSSAYNSTRDPLSAIRGPGAIGSGGATALDQQASLEMPRRELPSAQDLNLDRPQIRRRVNPYANVPSLYDLYSQVSPRSAMLERFGVNIFRNGTGNLDKLPMDLPAGPDYVLGPGDGVSIDIWGGIAQRLQRVVDPSGRLALPEAGTVPVAGKTLGDVQRLVQAALRTQFHEVEADVSLSRIRSVR
ncbi:MAG TPA: polysaccharide biosynthesis/export family protein, partial [Terriglobales bacterium]|nr:polysaccharide biosynthesis/export family protein [Terriglobales bacterium]